MWQIRNALEINRIVPVFVLQLDLRCILLGNNMEYCRDIRLQREPYEHLLDEFLLSNIRGQFRIFNSSSTSSQSSREVTQQLIDIIEGAYNVSM